MKSLFTKSFTTIVLLFITGMAQANTYYLTAAGSANAQTASNWNTNPAGGGTAASNFTTDNDIFIIPAGISGVVTANWTFGEGSTNGADLALTINGSLTINDGIVMTLAQKNAHTTTMTVANGGSLIFLGTTATNQLVGTKAGNASGSNSFTLATGGKITITEASGITGATGAINTTNINVTLNTSSNYEFAGGAETITGLPSTINDLTLSGSGTKTMGVNVTVTGVLTVSGTAVLDADGAGDNLVFTLSSSASGTASVAAGSAAGGYITGKVTVERFIADAGHRAWHLLSGKLVSGTQTIYNAWQEGGGTIVANKGTLITSNLYNGSNGFEATSISASILTHNQGGAAGPSWNYNLSNTNSTVLSSNQGYMLFVRGDRNYTPANGPSYNTTVLRTTGTLNQGTLSAVTVSSTGSGRTLVGNPYASPIDFESIYNSNHLDPNFYIWDPALTGNSGVGGFRIVERNTNGSYQQTPSLSGADANSRYIHSGQAIFLKATGGNASIVFTESAKVSTVSAVNPFMQPVGADQQVITNLLLVNAGNTASLADGIRVRFARSYSAGTDDDILKIGNFAENISSYREGKKLIVERRPMISAKDTIFLRMTNLSVNHYRFQVNTKDFLQTGITAFLEDAYLGTKSILKLNGDITDIDFKVTADGASAGQDRFRIVFATLTRSLQLTTSSVVRPTTGTSAQQTLNNKQQTTNSSSIALAKEGLKPETSITIYPNPVVNKTMQVQFTGMAKGIYQLRLISMMGQVQFVQQLNITEGGSQQSIKLGNNIAVGTYRLEIIKPDHTVIVKAVAIMN